MMGPSEEEVRAHIAELRRSASYVSRGVWEVVAVSVGSIVLAVVMALVLAKAGAL